MISCTTVRKPVIRRHYNVTTPFYRLLWGRHLHHGLFEADATPQAAQQKLTDRLIQEAGVQRGDHVLDVGCGMGGSSVYLAQSLDCDVTGITLSPVQRRWANWTSTWHGVRGQTDFQVQDAETADFGRESFHIVWSIECTEHLFDKPAFFRRAATWLQPGGRMAICAWLEGDTHTTGASAQQVRDVCEGFFCPSLGSMEDYQEWMTKAGLTVDRSNDWTTSVARTWEICQTRVKRTGARRLARLFGANMTMFLDRFDTILDAYQSGAMQYGCFVATKPMES